MIDIQCSIDMSHYYVPLLKVVTPSLRFWNCKSCYSWNIYLSLNNMHLY